MGPNSGSLSPGRNHRAGGAHARAVRPRQIRVRLAQRFNGFYHSSPVIAEENEAVRRWRAAGVHYFQSQMTRALDLMGCEVPERM